MLLLLLLVDQLFVLVAMEFIGLGYVCVCIPVLYNVKVGSWADSTNVVVVVVRFLLCIWLLLLLVRDENNFAVIYEFALVLFLLGIFGGFFSLN